jgi:hypothetical protein
MPAEVYTEFGPTPRLTHAMGDGPNNGRNADTSAAAYTMGTCVAVNA